MQQGAFSSVLLVIKLFFQSAFFLLFHAKGSPSAGFPWACYFELALPQWICLWHILWKTSSFFRLSFSRFETALVLERKKKKTVLPKYLDTPFVGGKFLEASFGKLKLWIFCSFFLKHCLFFPSSGPQELAFHFHKSWSVQPLRTAGWFLGFL